MKREKKVRMTFTIDKSLDDKWREVAKRLNLSRSAMLRQMLDEILPILDTQNPTTLIKNALEKSAKMNLEVSKLLDDKKD